MTMMPNINTLTELDHAIDVDTGQRMRTPREDVALIPAWGFANGPEAEIKLLRVDMEDCLQDVRDLLNSYKLTFEQELEVYNRVPLGKTANEIPKEQLIALVQEVLK